MRKYRKWILPITSVVLAVMALVCYTWMQEERTALMYVQVMAAALVPFIVPAIGTATKKEFPPAINLLITIHVFLASSLGSALDFYGRFASWDLVMHGYFGFVGAVTLYVLMLKWNGEALKGCGLLALIFLGTMGCAAIWEIFEFTADTFLGCDAQRVQEALRMGVSPVADTMTDIIVAAAGIAVFYVALWVDKVFSRRLIKYFANGFRTRLKKTVVKIRPSNTDKEDNAMVKGIIIAAVVVVVIIAAVVIVKKRNK